MLMPFDKFSHLDEVSDEAVQKDVFEGMRLDRIGQDAEHSHDAGLVSVPRRLEGVVHRQGGRNCVLLAKMLKQNRSQLDTPD